MRGVSILVALVVLTSSITLADLNLNTDGHSSKVQQLVDKAPVQEAVPEVTYEVIDWANQQLPPETYPLVEEVAGLTPASQQVYDIVDGTQTCRWMQNGVSAYSFNRHEVWPNIYPEEQPDTMVATVHAYLGVGTPSCYAEDMNYERTQNYGVDTYGYGCTHHGAWTQRADRDGNLLDVYPAHSSIAQVMSGTYLQYQTGAYYLSPSPFCQVDAVADPVDGISIDTGGESTYTAMVSPWPAYVQIMGNITQHANATRFIQAQPRLTLDDTANVYRDAFNLREADLSFLWVFSNGVTSSTGTAWIDDNTTLDLRVMKAGRWLSSITWDEWNLVSGEDLDVILEDHVCRTYPVPSVTQHQYLANADMDAYCLAQDFPVAGMDRVRAGWYTNDAAAFTSTWPAAPVIDMDSGDGEVVTLAQNLPAQRYARDLESIQISITGTQVDNPQAVGLMTVVLDLLVYDETLGSADDQVLLANVAIPNPSLGETRTITLTKADFQGTTGTALDAQLPLFAGLAEVKQFALVLPHTDGYQAAVSGVKLNLLYDITAQQYVAVQNELAWWQQYALGVVNPYADLVFYWASGGYESHSYYQWANQTAAYQKMAAENYVNNQIRQMTEFADRLEERGQYLQAWAEDFASDPTAESPYCPQAICYVDWAITTAGQAGCDSAYGTYLGTSSDPEAKQVITECWTPTESGGHRITIYVDGVIQRSVTSKF